MYYRQWFLQINDIDKQYFKKLHNVEKAAISGQQLQLLDAQKFNYR